MARFNVPPAGLSIAFIIILWQVLSMLIDLPAVFPSVTALLITLVNFLTSSGFYLHLVSTVLRGIIGFSAAFLAALGLAATFSHHPFWKSFFHPILVSLRSIPVISVILITLIWFAPPFLPAFIAFFTMFPILYQNILSGLESTDTKLIELATVLNKTPLQRFFQIYVPAAHPIIMSGTATAMGFGWRAIIIGEVLAGPIHGIGTAMKKAQAFIEVKELLAWTVIAVLISFLFDGLLKLYGKRPISHPLKYEKSAKPLESHHIDYKEFKIINLNKEFNKRSVISNMTVTCSNNNISLIKTASGSGKTTLMNLIANILPHDSGCIELDKNYTIAYCFQDTRLLPWLSAKENIAYGLPSYPRINEFTATKLNQLIDLLELNIIQNKKPDQLSGGEQQRVALARALFIKSDILLLDEPLTGLGNELKIKLIQVIEKWVMDYRPIILWATHDAVEKHLQTPYTIISQSFFQHRS